MEGLTLADFAGLLREVPWSRLLRSQNFPEDAAFAAYFTRNPPDHFTQDMFFLRVLRDGDPSGLPFLKTQFPSLSGDISSHAFEMSRDDFAKMRLLFGGTGWT